MTASMSSRGVKPPYVPFASVFTVASVKNPIAKAPDLIAFLFLVWKEERGLDKLKSCLQGVEIHTWSLTILANI